jgi:V/A-type H+-transporting ATPase subunit I
MQFLGMEVLSLPQAVYSSLPYLMLASIILIVIASIAERGYFMGSIFWLFEITGILGDVMSYARLAGVGLATYYLAFCFNLMGPLLAGLLPAGIIRMVFGTILIIAVLLVGHIVNLILSSLTCFVHSLRLCFVEFLFKFYEAGGRPYNPFHIRKREMILVKERG